MTPEERRIYEYRLANLDKDLCLTCGSLVMTDIGGGPCEKNHMTVHQRLCAGDCGTILGLYSQDDEAQVYCQSCMLKVRQSLVGADQTPRQLCGDKCVLVHPAKDLYVYEVRGVVMVTWCSKQDVHFARKFPIEGIEEIARSLSRVAGVDLLYEVVGVDVLV